MILSTSIHHYLLSLLLLFYFVDVECDPPSAVDASTTQIIPTSNKSLAVVVPSFQSIVEAVNDTAVQLDIISTQSTSKPLGVVPQEIDTVVTPEAKWARTNATQSTADKIITKLEMPFVKNTPTSFTFFENSNSTVPARNTKKRSVLLIFLLISIGLTTLVLIASLVLYVLIKQGRIRVFNRSRTPKKANEHGRMVDSSSIDDRGSPSQKELDMN